MEERDSAKLSPNKKNDDTVQSIQEKERLKFMYRLADPMFSH